MKRSLFYILLLSYSLYPMSFIKKKHQKPTLIEIKENPNKVDQEKLEQELASKINGLTQHIKDTFLNYTVVPKEEITYAQAAILLMRKQSLNLTPFDNLRVVRGAYNNIDSTQEKVQKYLLPFEKLIKEIAIPSDLQAKFKNNELSNLNSALEEASTWLTERLRNQQFLEKALIISKKPSLKK